MELGNPNAASGQCNGDNLVIAAGATNLIGPSTPPTLCGTNTGQHGNTSNQIHEIENRNTIKSIEN